MKVVCCAATKGGCGKTSVCALMVVASLQEGAKVAVIDLDPQQNLASWCQLRKLGEMPKLLEGGSVSDLLEMARKEKFAWVFIDTPPALLPIIEAAVSHANLVVIPVRASPLDLMSVDSIAEMCEENNRPFVFVLNAVPPRTAYGEQAAKELKKDGRVLSVSISNRQSIVMAMLRGQTGPEIDRGDQCAAEVASAWLAVKRLVK